MRVGAIAVGVIALVLVVAVLVYVQVFAPAGDSPAPAVTEDASSQEAAPGGESESEPDDGDVTVHAVGETWEHQASESDDATVWGVSVEGYIELEFEGASVGDGGRCIGIVGTLTPTRIADGAESTSWLDAPLSGVYVDDTLYDAVGQCDSWPLADAGYAKVFGSEIPLGTPYRYYATAHVPEGVDGDIQYIWVGSYTDTQAGLVEPGVFELP